MQVGRKREKMGNKNIKHKKIGNLAASVFFDESFKYMEFLNAKVKMDDICVCVSESKEMNVKWWCGDEKAVDLLHNKSTGNFKTFSYIAKTIQEKCKKRIETDGFYICSYTPTDTHRDIAYKSILTSMCKKQKLYYKWYAFNRNHPTYIWVITDNEYFIDIFDYSFF